MLREIGTNNIYNLNIPGKTIIGRAKICDIQPESTSISKQHALILSKITENNLKMYWIEDLGSRNGTSIKKNNEWKIVEKNIPQEIHKGDFIKFGHSSATYILEEQQHQQQEEEENNELDSSEILYEREPLNYSPEVLSSSVNKARLSKELESATPIPNKLQFSIEYPSTDQIKDYPPISVQVGGQQLSQSTQLSQSKQQLKNSSKNNLNLSSERIQPKMSESLQRSNSPNIGLLLSQNKDSKLNKHSNIQSKSKENNLYLSSNKQDLLDIMDQQPTSSPLKGENFDQDNNYNIDDNDNDDYNNEINYNYNYNHYNYKNNHNLSNDYDNEDYNYNNDYDNDNNNNNDNDDENEDEDDLPPYNLYESKDYESHQNFYDSDPLEVMGIGYKKRIKNEPPLLQSHKSDVMTRLSQIDKSKNIDSNNNNNNKLASSLPNMQHNNNHNNSQINPLRSSSPGLSQIHSRKFTQIEKPPLRTSPLPQAQLPLSQYQSTITNSNQIPINSLTPQEISQIQSSREGLADGVRVANKILGGVAPFEDWKKYTSTTLSKISPLSENIVPPETIFQQFQQHQLNQQQFSNSQFHSHQQINEVESKFKILITPQVIQSVQAESMIDTRETSIGISTKFKNNLIFLLEYEIGDTDIENFGTWKDDKNNMKNKFPSELFNKMLVNSLQLLSKKLLSTELIQKLTESVESLTIQPITTTISSFILNQMIPKIQGLIVFNESWTNQSSTSNINTNINTNTNIVSPPIKIETDQIFQINQYICSNLMNDIESILDCLIQLKNTILKENIQLTKYIIKDKNLQNTNKKKQLKNKIKNKINNENDENENDIDEDNNEDEDIFQAEYLSDGELKITTTPRTSINKNQEIKKSSKEKKNTNGKDTKEEVGISQHLWEKLSQNNEQEKQKSEEKEKKLSKSISLNSSSNDVKGQKNELKHTNSYDKSSLVVKKIENNEKNDKNDKNAAADDDDERKSSEYSQWKNKEFELKSKAVMLIKRIRLKLFQKVATKLFHRWKLHIKLSKESEQNKIQQDFLKQGKENETKQIQEVLKSKETELKKYYEEVIESKDKKIQSILSSMNQTDVDVNQLKIHYEQLLEEKDKRIKELEKNQESLQENKQQLELQYGNEIQNLIRRNSMLEQNGIQNTLLNKQKLRVLRLLATNSEKLRLHMRRCFNIWKEKILSEIQKHQKNQEKIKQLERVLKLSKNNTLTRRLLTRAFRKWEKKITPQTDLILVDNQKLQNISMLRSKLFSLQEELFIMCQSNEIASQLHAERALNREITSINFELQQKLTEIETKLLEFAKIPLTERKQLVREVLLDRENEVMRLRKECRALKEQITKLESVLRTNEINLQSERQNDKSKLKSDRNKKYNRHYYNNDNNHDDDDDDENDDEVELSKQEAMKIVVKELRKLQSRCLNLEQTNMSLGTQLCEEIERYQKQSISLNVLQQKLLKKEKLFENLNNLLIDKYGDVTASELLSRSYEMN